MKNYKISIPNPCTEDWSLMTQTEKGKHCASCNKVVIDFSNKTDKEIIEILLLQKGKKVCGNFYNTQIENPIRLVEYTKHAKWPAIAAMLIAGLFQVNTSFAQTDRNTHTDVKSYYLSTTKGEVKETEPAKDSLITYSIKVLAKDGKYAIPGATVIIESIGTYTSDEKGMIQFSIAEKDIPSIIKVELYAYGYETIHTSIQKVKITKTKNIELFLGEREKYMLRGDISIEDSH